MDDKKVFNIVSDDGRVTECRVIAAFTSPENRKHYIIYTDGSIDQTGRTRVFASRYNPEQKDSGALLPITTAEEWKMIETVLANSTFSGE